MSAERVESQRLLEVFNDHRTADIRRLRPWQKDVLERYAAIDHDDAAIEAPTGSGKTLPALIIAEEFRQREERSVAYVTGNKQLARQVQRQAASMDLPVVRFQESKHDWDPDDVTAYEWGEAIGVMNYWVYFNEKPGVQPAGLLILDDVHLVESTLRGFHTMELPHGHPLLEPILELIARRFPYYGIVEDVLEGRSPPGPPEMLAFVDSAEITPEVRVILDKLPEGTPPWWGWRRIGRRAEVCCWLVSPRGLAITPYIVPTQDMTHFAEPTRRLYLSATVGTVDDVQRRLGCPGFEKLTAKTAPRQGERFVIVRDETTELPPHDLVALLKPFVARNRKALWLCTRTGTADELFVALGASELEGSVYRLQEANGADEAFAAAPAGNLVAQGRYDGMDFPHDACRIEVLPEVPVALSALEEFTTAYLRDATFADARFAQRVAQALGRCNRADDDRAVYLLMDPEFRGRLTRKSVMSSLPIDVQADIARALRTKDGFAKRVTDAQRFLDGASFPEGKPPASVRRAVMTTAGNEVEAMLSLWSEDYAGAANTIEILVESLPQDSREYKAFWVSLRALALSLHASRYGDASADVQAGEALREAVAVGGRNTFFARLRAAIARAEGGSARIGGEEHDRLFESWDSLIERLNVRTGRISQYVDDLINDISSDSHDRIANAIARFGRDVLAIDAEAPQPTQGEPDVILRFKRPRRSLSLEVKLAPKAKTVSNADVEQAEGAVTWLRSKEPESEVRGLLLTPHDNVAPTAEQRLERVHLVRRDHLVAEVIHVLTVFQQYAKGWTRRVADREARRAAVERDLPPLDWLYCATDTPATWVDDQALERARRARGRRKVNG